MTIALLHVLASFIPHAHGAAIEQLGAGAPGISEMWGVLKSVFPYTDMGEGGLAFLTAKIADFILRIIGGIAVVVIIYAGIRMIIGGEEGFGEAKKILTYAVLGLILAMCADAIVIFSQVLILQMSQ